MAKQKGKKIWRSNFSIRNTHYQTATPAFFAFMNYQPKIFQGLIHECVWVQKGVDNVNSYIPISQLRRLIERTLEVIEKQPALVNKIHRETMIHIRNYFQYAARVKKMDLKKMSVAELIKAYNKLMYYQMIQHSWAIATTWFVDSDNEDFSKLLIKRLGKLTARSRYQAAEAFSILTTPEKPSLAFKEELEALEILRLIVKDRTASKIFKQADTARIERDLDRLPAALRRKIYQHFNKWCWTPFTYTGPAYDLDYYLALWSGWLKEKFDLEKKIWELKDYAKHLKAQKTRLIKDLKIDSATQTLFQIASDIVYLKAYRKDACFFGMYVLDSLLREIGRRLELGINQVRFMAHWEIPAALRTGHFSEKTLNDRFKFSVYYQKDGRGVIYTGAAAKRFLARLKVERIKVADVSVISGTVACPGKAKGAVKIINLPEEMGKMRPGDIMVAHTTFPSLVPAMKKAVGIITDDGGITCHAAIVARELKTPCLVGTKIATQALHDGDRVEMDAGKGMMRIIKR